MQASEIMSRPVVTTTPDSLLRDAVVKLTDGEYISLPVLNENGQVVGILTEGDALRAAESLGTDSGPAPRVGDVMRRATDTVSTDTDVTELARMMLTDRLRSLPVVEDDGTLVGIVSRRDVLRPLVRPDDVVAAHVQALLDAYSGQRRTWSAEVSDGLAKIGGAFADPAERGVVASLVRTVPGVVDVEIGSG